MNIFVTWEGHLAVGGVSSLPAAAVAVVAFAAVVMLILGLRSARFSRYDTAAPSMVRSGALIGVGVSLAVLAVSAFRHYGGTTGDGYTVPRTSACQAWWYAVAAHGSTVQGGSAAYCRHAAVAAIWPAIGMAAAIGLVTACLTAGVIALSRRRHDRHLDSPATRSL